MTTETLIVAGVIVLLVVVTFIGLLSRYRKCASDEILVVFGKAGKKKVGEEVVPLEDFEKEFKFSLQDLTNWWNKKILELE